MQLICEILLYIQPYNISVFFLVLGGMGQMVFSDKKYISNKLKEYRLKSGLTQESVAEKINIDTNHYGKLERGLYYPSVETFLKAISCLQIPIEEFGINMTKEITNSSTERIIKELVLSNEKEKKLIHSIVIDIKKVGIK